MKGKYASPRQSGEFRTYLETSKKKKKKSSYSWRWGPGVGATVIAGEKD